MKLIWSHNSYLNYSFKILQLIFLIQFAESRIKTSPDQSHSNSLEDVKFYLYTPENPNVPQPIDIHNGNGLSHLDYNPNYSLKILCHGLSHDYLTDPGMITSIKQAYMACALEPINVIGVDWIKYTKRIHNIPLTNFTIEEYNDVYVDTANFAQKVGEVTAELLNYLVKTLKTKPKKIHLVGFSLGAHCMGFAGYFYEKIYGGKVNRITGLDPAGWCYDTEMPLLPILSPNFLNCTLFRHLTENDAEFVDILHTDANYMGISYSIGHVDFWINGGFLQPNCGQPIEASLSTCSHRRAVNLYAESICNDKTFLSSRNCSNFGNELTQTVDCNSNERVYMGEYLPSNTRGNFYTKTNGKSPYSLPP